MNGYSERSHPRHHRRPSPQLRNASPYNRNTLKPSRTSSTARPTANWPPRWDSTPNPSSAPSRNGAKKVSWKMSRMGNTGNSNNDIGRGVCCLALLLSTLWLALPNQFLVLFRLILFKASLKALEYPHIIFVHARRRKIVVKLAEILSKHITERLKDF